MKKFTSLMAGVAALALSAGASEAADLYEPMPASPSWAATISAGSIFTWTDYKDHYDGSTDSGSWGDYWTPFGEASVLWAPFGNNFFFQSDFAYSSHRFDPSSDSDFPSIVGNMAASTWHSGGVLFLRDPMMGLIGIDGAFGGNDFSGTFPTSGYAYDVWRIGGRGEWYLGNTATIGGGVGYHELDLGNGKDADGINANAFLTWYAMPQLAIKAEFSYAQFNESNYDFWDNVCSCSEGAYYVDTEAWSIGGEAEYLLSELWGGNSSVFAGGRYTESSSSFYDKVEKGPKVTLDDTQVFVGFRYYFNTTGDLANNHRTNTVSNTNTLLEKVPRLMWQGLDYY